MQCAGVGEASLIRWRVHRMQAQVVQLGPGRPGVPYNLKSVWGGGCDEPDLVACARMQAQVVQLGPGRPGVPYDALSLDVGITPSADGVPGALQHATPVKPVSKCACVVFALLSASCLTCCVILFISCLVSRCAGDWVTRAGLGHARPLAQPPRSSCGHA
jgi:hypothetical protein